MQRSLSSLSAALKSKGCATFTPYKNSTSLNIHTINTCELFVPFSGQILIKRDYAKKNPYKKKNPGEEVIKLNFEDAEQLFEDFKEQIKLPPPPSGWKLPAQPYRLVAGVILERVPICLPEPATWFSEYESYRKEIDTELDKAQEEISNLRAEMEMKLRAKKAKKKDDKNAAAIAAAKAAAKKDKSQEGDEEAAEVDDTVYPIITADDEANNRKSLYRKLRNRLYLIVKKDRADHAWQFPQGEYEEADGNVLRNTAEREFAEELGKDMDVYFMGYGPLSHHVYKAGDKQTKAFFYKAQYLNGNPVLNQKELSDYLWVTKEEMKEYLSPDLYNSVKDSLLD